MLVIVCMSFLIFSLLWRKTTNLFLLLFCHKAVFVDLDVSTRITMLGSHKCNFYTSVTT